MRLVLSILLVSAVIAFAETDAKAVERAPEPYSKLFETGPLKVRVELDRTNLRLDEFIVMKLEVVAPEEYTVAMPKLDDGLEQFRWELESSSAPQLDANGDMHYMRTTRLEPIVIYEKTSVKPLAVHFKGRDGKEHDIETDEIEIKVEMPPEEFWKNLDIDRTASETPVKRLNSPVPKWTWWAVAAVVLCALAVVAVMLARRRRAVKEETPVRPPQEIALEELRALVDRHLVEDGHLMEFYNCIQDILRRYIEARFGLMAPERTTEEFLDELRGNGNKALAKYDKLLSGFLTHCDLVRFAAHSPAKEEIQATFSACREFILATAE